MSEHPRRGYIRGWVRWFRTYGLRPIPHDGVLHGVPEFATGDTQTLCGMTVQTIPDSAWPRRIIDKCDLCIWRAEHRRAADRGRAWRLPRAFIVIWRRRA